MAIDSEVQFSFRDSIEPVYRQLISLLLQDNSTQNNLEQARQVIESLQLAELDNFFHDTCTEAQLKQIDRSSLSFAAFRVALLAFSASPTYAI